MIQQMTGGIFSSFGTMVAFGYFHPVVITVFVGVAIVVGSEPAVDVESRVVDLVLARPIRRGHLVTRSVLMLALVTTSLGLLMVASSWLSLRMVGPRGVLSAGVLFRLALNLAAVAWVVGALALAAAAFVRRRSTAAGSVAIIALALYLVNFLADVLPRVRPYAPLSPFHYYQPLGIVTGMGTRWGSDVRLLVIVAALLTAAAFVAFSRRDL
jgi:putative exporter of polyketide antibiotics